MDFRGGLGMTRDLVARRVLRLYPASWRYGDGKESHALIDDLVAAPDAKAWRFTLSLVVGAIAAWFRRARQARYLRTVGSTVIPKRIPGNHCDLLLRRGLSAKSQVDLYPGEQVHVLVDACKGNRFCAGLRNYSVTFFVLWVSGATFSFFVQALPGESRWKHWVMAVITCSVLVVISWIIGVATRSYPVTVAFTTSGIAVFRVSWWNHSARFVQRLPAVDPELIKSSSIGWRHVRLGTQSFWFATSSDPFLVWMSRSFLAS